MSKTDTEFVLSGITPLLQDLKFLSDKDNLLGLDFYEYDFRAMHDRLDDVRSFLVKAQQQREELVHIYSVSEKWNLLSSIVPTQENIVSECSKNGDGMYVVRTAKTMWVVACSNSGLDPFICEVPRDQWGTVLGTSQLTKRDSK